MLDIFKQRQQLFSDKLTRLQVLNIADDQPERELAVAGAASLYCEGGLLDCDSRSEIERRLKARQNSARIFTEAEPSRNADAATKRKVYNAARIEQAVLIECSYALKLLHEDKQRCTSF